ncbi:MAG TPA: amidohydrolase family protein [Thermoanaerobaculia bacterium]|nr:amidohydrolase family protein [Thermoanaerobaculia bacterium]
MRYGFALAFVLLWASSGVAASPSKPALQIIDVHTHLEFEDTPDRSRADFLKQMKEAGVTQAVNILHTDDGRIPDHPPAGIIHCAGVGETPNLHGLQEGLAGGRYRCVKIYLGYVHRYASDPVYEPVYRLAEQFDVPVIFHTGDTSSSKAKLKYADPLTIDEVAVDHPNVRFVIAHCGNPWIESAAEVAYKNPNVYLDGSAFFVGDVGKLPREKVDEYMVKPLAWIFGYLENPSKLMFGSDWPLVDIPPYVEAFKRAIPRQHWSAVFHDNAVRVFKLNEASPPGEK